MQLMPLYTGCRGEQVKARPHAAGFVVPSPERQLHPLLGVGSEQTT